MEFDEFVILASKFIVEEDSESLQKELKEAFRLYDKEGECWLVEGRQLLYQSESSESGISVKQKCYQFLGFN